MAGLVDLGSLVFQVLGVPTPQGSKSRMPNGAIVEAGTAKSRAAKKEWRTAVAETAKGIVGDRGPISVPMLMSVQFRFPMTKSRRKWEQAQGWAWKVTYPDLDKLLRATGDALKVGGLIKDDALISSLGSVDRIETTGWTGAVIALYSLDGYEPVALMAGCDFNCRALDPA